MTDKRDLISRRDFASRSVLAAAAVAAGKAALQPPGRGSGAGAGGERPRGARRASASAARATPSRRASPACRTSRSRPCATSTRTSSRAAPTIPRSQNVPTFKPGYQQDLRRVLEDKDIDGVLIATPNHWHALATIWAMQAGKHVYVEKPASHTVWEGRQMVEAAKQVQARSCRSAP